MIDPNNPLDNGLNDAARVYFLHTPDIYGCVYLPHVGLELPGMILNAFDRIHLDGYQGDPGALAAIFIWQAVATGNIASLFPVPQSPFPQATAALQQQYNAIGGIGSVFLDPTLDIVQTYGGAGFKQIREANKYALTTYTLDELREIPPWKGEGPGAVPAASQVEGLQQEILSLEARLEEALEKNKSAPKKKAATKKKAVARKRNVQG